MVSYGIVVLVVEEMYAAVLATPKRQRRLRSKTFWDRFGFERRTQERVARVWAALRDRGLVLNFDEASFGSEGRDEWIILSFVDSPIQEPPSRACRQNAGSIDA